MRAASEATQRAGSRGGSPLRLLAALASLNVLSYVDRQLVAALAPLLIADLHLSRADIGLLIGLSFMAVFAVATLAMGLAADRLRRSRLLAAGLAVWSAATGLSATARGFVSLATWRSLVGIGEATLSPAALSMLADRFPPGRLGLANGVFYAGIPIGFGASFAIGGWLGPRYGWRACFAALGSAGLAASVLALRIGDPPRSRSAATGSPRPTARLLFRTLRDQPAVLLLIAAGVLLAFASASSQHGITWLVAERGFAYPRAAWLSAVITASAGLAGNLGLGLATDRAQRLHPQGRLLAFAAIGACALPAAAAYYTAPPSSPLFLPCWFLTQAFLLGWYGPLLAAILERSPAELRASCAGFALLAINLLGVATGPWVTGVIGDRFSLTRGLLTSLIPAALGLALAAAVSLAAHDERS